MTTNQIPELIISFKAVSGIGEKFDYRNQTHMEMLYDYLVTKAIVDGMTLAQFYAFYNKVKTVLRMGY